MILPNINRAMASGDCAHSANANDDSCRALAAHHAKIHTQTLLEIYVKFSFEFFKFPLSTLFPHFTSNSAFTTINIHRYLV